VDEKWWKESLSPFLTAPTAHDKEEDEELNRLMLDRPIPTTLKEYAFAQSRIRLKRCTPTEFMYSLVVFLVNLHPYMFLCLITAEINKCVHFLSILCQTHVAEANA
jgi:hypothetical protein